MGYGILPHQTKWAMIFPEGQFEMFSVKKLLSNLFAAASPFSSKPQDTKDIVWKPEDYVEGPIDESDKQLLETYRIGDRPTLYYVIDSNLSDDFGDDHVIALIRSLRAKYDVFLRLEAVDALEELTLIESNVLVVVRLGAVKPLISTLSSKYARIARTAAEVLQNIAYVGSEMTEILLSNDVVEPLMYLLNPDIHVDVICAAMLVFKELFCYMNLNQRIEVQKCCLPSIASLLDHSDGNVRGNAAWFFSFITAQFGDKRTMDVVNVDVLPKLIEMVNYREVIQAVKIFANVATSSVQAKKLIEVGVLTILPNLLKHENDEIVKLSSWMVANLTRGSANVIDQIVEAGLVPSILSVAASADLESGFLWALEAASNILGSNKKSHVDKFFERESIDLLKDTLKFIDDPEERKILLSHLVTLKDRLKKKMS